MKRALSPLPLYQFNISRSGSFLLRQMLSANPASHVASEALLELYRSFRNAALRKNGGVAAQQGCPTSAPMQDYYFTAERIAALDCIQQSSLDLPFDGDRNEFIPRFRDRMALDCADLAEHAAEVEGSTYRELFDSTRDMIARSREVQSARWIGCGDSWAIEFLGPLAATYPEAKFIITFRDPRAIISSNLAEIKIDPSWVGEPLSYMRHWRKLFAFTYHYLQQPSLKNRIYVLRFEDLSADPERQARSLCEFLEIPYHANMIDTNTFRDYSKGGVWQGNSAFQEQTSGFSTARTTRWREKLPSSVRKLIEFCCAQELAALGYEFDTPSGAFPDAEVIEYLETAATTYANWRSSLGDVARDLGAELFRANTLMEQPLLSTELARQNFLFTDVYEALTADVPPRILSY